MEDLIDNYVFELESMEEFKRLKELKIIIDEKYKKEIFFFKMRENEYQEGLKYPDKYDMSLLKQNYSNAKKELYKNPEVKEYIDLERKIQSILDKDFNKIKEAISKKFVFNNPFCNCK